MTEQTLHVLTQDVAEEADADTSTLSTNKAKKLLANGLPVLLTDHCGSHRAIFHRYGMLAIVKHFPNGGPEDKWSVKFYTPIEAAARVITYWKTIYPVHDTALLAHMERQLDMIVAQIRGTDE